MVLFAQPLIVEYLFLNQRNKLRMFIIWGQEKDFTQMFMEKEKLIKKLVKIEKELSTCRTSVMQDGWQTSRHAKKARKWDYYAQLKMKLIQQIEDEKSGND